MQNWQPSAKIQTLKQRASIVNQIREFFTKRNYLEVETPYLSRYGVSDPYIKNIKTQVDNERFYLQTSPEYHMKRLLSYQSGAIFQISRVFRDDEIGRYHNPEFSLLEWYHLGIDHHGLIAETSQFLQEILHCKALVKITYKDIFLKVCKMDPFTADIQEFKNVLKAHNLDNVLNVDEIDRDQYLFLIMSHIVEPHMSQSDCPIAVYDFPKSQAALARVKDDKALRFEVYFKGIELANGFYELLDSQIQQKRFDIDNQKRNALRQEMIQPNPYLLDALKNGIPECSGIALGVDRLIMLALDKDHISEVLSFDVNRA